jgi:hypothetical protein
LSVTTTANRFALLELRATTDPPPSVARIASGLASWP